MDQMNHQMNHRVNRGIPASPSMGSAVTAASHGLSHRIAHCIRIVTVPPVMVAALILLLTVYRPDVIATSTQSIMAILFLAILPALAYPLSVAIPSLRKKGRDGQRSLAIYLSVAGYTGACIYGALAQVPRHLLMIFITYFLSVLLLLGLNKGLHIKASGHACSLTGPIALMCYYLGAWWVAVGGVLYALILWASVKMGRHTFGQFLWGSACCLSAWALVMLVGMGL